MTTARCRSFSSAGRDHSSSFVSRDWSVGRTLSAQQPEDASERSPVEGRTDSVPSKQCLHC